MSEILSQLLQWVTDNPGWAGFIVFLISLTESLAIVGMIVPGVLILFGVGALIGSGVLDFWIMCSWAVAGAVLGDGLSFWLGRNYHHRLQDFWPFSRHPESLQQGVNFFHKYGGKSVAFGRFFGPVRAIIPLVAGMLRMPPDRFLTANILSAIAWAPAYLLPGMAFGASLELASEVAVRLVILVLALVITLWFLGWLSHRIFLLLQPHSQSMLHWLISFGSKHKWLRGIASALADPTHPESRGLAALAGLLIFSVLTLIFLSPFLGSPLEPLDKSIHLALSGLTTPAGNQAMLAVSSLAGNAVTLAALLSVWTLLRIYDLPLASRHWLSGLIVIFIYGAIAEYVLLTSPEIGKALPDTYVLRAAVIYGLTAIISVTCIPITWRWTAYSGATVIIMAVSFAQLYHGSAFSAVILSLTIGLIWTTALGVAYRTHSPNEALQARQGIVIGALVLLLGTLSLATTNGPATQPRLFFPQASVNATDWWETDWQSLPATRNDVRQLGDTPFNLQYQGSSSSLIKALTHSGWQEAAEPSGLDWLRLLSPTSKLKDLPLLPNSHDGHYESLALIKQGDGKRWVLRLWPSKILLSPGNQPLWLGTVSSQVSSQKLGVFSYPDTETDYQAPLVELQKSLSGSILQHQLVRQQGLMIIREALPQNGQTATNPVPHPSAAASHAKHADGPESVTP